MRATTRRRLAAITAILTAVPLFTSCFSERLEGPDNSVVGGACQVSDFKDLLGPGKAIVVIKNFSFQPATLRVRPGTTVTWVNCDAGVDPHTSTSNSGAWDSPLLQAGTTFSRAFGQTGTFDYHCTPHPFMTGSIVVDPAA